MEKLYLMVALKSNNCHCICSLQPRGQNNLMVTLKSKNTGAPNGNFRENICSEDDLRSRIFGTFAVKFLACLPLVGFSNIYKMV